MKTQNNRLIKVYENDIKNAAISLPNIIDK